MKAIDHIAIMFLMLLALILLSQFFAWLVALVSPRAGDFVQSLLVFTSVWVVWKYSRAIGKKPS